jgi:hypothetical protein
MKTLWDDKQDLFLTDMPLVLDELERLIQSEPQAADLVSSYVADHVASLSIIAQCLNQLKSFQPWARGYEGALGDYLVEIEAEYEDWLKARHSLTVGLKAEYVERVGTLADPANRRFFYPSDKRRTKENVEAMRRAENNLDAFWSAMDELVYERCGPLTGTTIRKVLSEQEQRVLQRTPEWVDDGATTTGKKQQKPVSTTNNDLGVFYKPLSTLYFNLSGSTPESTKPSKAQLKTKIKTKGAAQGALAETADTTSSDRETQQQAMIPVDARSLKVFRTLFFNPGVTSSPGELSWHDFVHAMTSTGLFSAEKLYGSVWQFQRLDEESQGRIQFHQPHPRGKIPFTMARRYGRRLNRAFGWVGSLFVLKEGGAGK